MSYVKCHNYLTTTSSINTLGDSTAANPTAPLGSTTTFMPVLSNQTITLGSTTTFMPVQSNQTIALLPDILSPKDG
jgi:hypothetical protein